MIKIDEIQELTEFAMSWRLQESRIAAWTLVQWLITGDIMTKKVYLWNPKHTLGNIDQKPMLL